MNNLAIIPARAGSKRIPNKNIKDFNGLPVIGYAIKTALKSELFRDVLVSTDSEEIAEIARSFGASVISRRAENLSDDFTTTSKVLQYEVKKYIESVAKINFVCCIYPVTPLLKYKRLIEGFEKINNGNWNYVFSCQTVKSHPERLFKLREDESIELNKTGSIDTRTQDLPEFFHDAGQFYWGKMDAWLNLSPIFSKESSVIRFLPNEVVDIDTFDDWRYAELLLKLEKSDL